jgi:hypothetical protein
LCDIRFFIKKHGVRNYIDEISFTPAYSDITFVNTSISTGRSKVVGNIKRSPNRNLSRTTIMIITIILMRYR